MERTMMSQNMTIPTCCFCKESEFFGPRYIGPLIGARETIFGITPKYHQVCYDAAMRTVK